MKAWDIFNWPMIVGWQAKIEWSLDLVQYNRKISRVTLRGNRWSCILITNFNGKCILIHIPYLLPKYAEVYWTWFVPRILPTTGRKRKTLTLHGWYSMYCWPPSVHKKTTLWLISRELTYPIFKKHGWWDMLVPRRVKGQVRAGLLKWELLGNHHKSGLRYTKKTNMKRIQGWFNKYDLVSPRTWYLYLWSIVSVWDVSLHSIHTCSYSIYSNQSFTVMTY